MRFYVEYPLSADADNGAWVDPANMARLARAAEASGVDAIALTDHPAPSRKWRDGGGHDTLDPFTGLTFFAAHTSTLRVMTHLTVVPYRNPFLLAKAMSSVDLLSGGRAIFVVGTGYLRSEFAALGADFENRNEVFDEAMDVVRGALSSPHAFHHEGKHFTGLGVTMSPPPVQQPYPPIWLGGNAAIVRRRVAQWGNGWAPMTLGGQMLSKVARTAPILSLPQLGEQIGRIKDDMTAHGRNPESLDVSAAGTEIVPLTASNEQKLDHIARLAEVGVTWTIVPVDKLSFVRTLDVLEEFGTHVIAASR
jgi:probable F420-dependent oxidoreductase